MKILKVSNSRKEFRNIFEKPKRPRDPDELKWRGPLAFLNIYFCKKIHFCIKNWRGTLWEEFYFAKNATMTKKTDKDHLGYFNIRSVAKHEGRPIAGKSFTGIFLNRTMPNKN